MQTKTKIHWNILLPLAITKLLLHFLTNTNYGLHRDEYLYVAESEHLSWGYMEVPPMIAVIGKMAMTIFGNTVFGVRFFPAIIGAISILLIGVMARDLGGKKYAQGLAGLAFLLSPAFLGSNQLFQPVSFNQFMWLLSAFFTVKILRCGAPKYWYALGITAGLGFLTKYSIVFFFTGLIVGFLLTPYRKVFTKKEPYIALGIALFIAFPNLLWQIKYDLPVMRHMADLASSQLVNVGVGDFILPQFLFHFAAVPIWLAGLFWFLKQPTYRILGITYLVVIGLLLALSGKAYYSIGAYSMLFAAGGVFWERQLEQKAVYIFTPLLLLNLFLIPYSIPIFKIEAMKNYLAWMAEHAGIDAPLRWEDGVYRDLTQDYADMHGWDELPAKVAKIYHQLSPEEQAKTLVWGGNYGHAGALNFYRKEYNLPVVYSFNSSFVMWTPDTLDIEYQIQVEDNYQSPSPYFEETILLDSITNPYARDPGYIYLKRGAKGDLGKIWQEIVAEERAAAGY
ncbi:MAG: ArnT family glycosyltransferase [Saprospiraceae bacterium]